MLPRLLLLAVFGCCLYPTVTGNYLLDSYEAAVQMKQLYENDIEYWREWLTIEAQDMDFFFIELVFIGINRATAPEHGYGIAKCTAEAAETSRNNIIYMDEVMIEVQDIANTLHLTVFDLLSTTNIKEQDLELFYYYHSYVMEETEWNLWFLYYEMYDAWLAVLMDFFDVRDRLFLCIDAVTSSD